MPRGTDRERAVVHELCATGWLAWRTRGSLTGCDVFASKAGESNRYIQVKSVAAGGPFNAFGPAARAELRKMAEVGGGMAWLVHWPPRKPARWIPEPDWPQP